MSQKHLNSSSVCQICCWHWTIVLQHGEHRGMPYTCSDVFVISLQGLSQISFSVYESNWSISVQHHISSSFYFMPIPNRRSEERRVGKGVDLGGRRIIKKKKPSTI